MRCVESCPGLLHPPGLGGSVFLSSPSISPDRGKVRSWPAQTPRGRPWNAITNVVEWPSVGTLVPRVPIGLSIPMSEATSIPGPEQPPATRGSPCLDGPVRQPQSAPGPGSPSTASRVRRSGGALLAIVACRICRLPGDGDDAVRRRRPQAGLHRLAATASTRGAALEALVDRPAGDLVGVAPCDETAVFVVSRRVRATEGSPSSQVVPRPAMLP